MLKIYFLTAIRSLLRNSSYSLMNIVGLTLGITCSILLLLVVKYELSFDTFHSKADQTYRVYRSTNRDDQSTIESSVHFPTAQVLRQNNPGIELMAQVFGEEGGQVTIEGKGNFAPKHYLEEGIIAFVEPDFFRIFDFVPQPEAVAAGFDEPNTAVLTQSLADKYFPGENATGKVIKYNNLLTLKVVGVVPDFPANTDFPFVLLISYPSLKKYSTYDLTSWNYSVSQQNLYVTVPENTDPIVFENILNETLKPHLPPEKRKEADVKIQPLHDLHYNPDLTNYASKTVSKDLIWGMATIGVFLLLTACINFINLATAQAIKRAKEVGVRKVMGSNQLQLMFQFFGETLLITVLATFLSVILAELTLPYLNELLEVKIVFNMLEEPSLLLFLLLEVLAVTLLSGIYPAIVMSGFRPIDALKSRIATQKISGFSLRSALVVLQFTICQVLIICTFIVTEQMQYLRNKPLGFDKEGVVQLFLPKREAKKLMVHREELLSNPAIKHVSFAVAAPSANITFGTSFYFDSVQERMPFTSHTKFADEQYFEMYDLKFVAGRPYRKSDTIAEVVINETMRRKLGLSSPEEAIGKKVSFGKTFIDKREYFPIVGVVEDFHQNSLHAAVDPSLMTTDINNYLFMTAKIDLNNTEEALQHLEKVWYKAYPDNVFDYSFLDETLANFYQEETRQNILFRVFSFIAILIGCIGLYGLVAFMAAQRTKEVGIRKVMGASLLDITLLFSKEFLKMVFIAFVIAAPIAYYIMERWLEDFTYRISIDYVPFLIAGAATTLLALLTMSSKAIQAALADPVQSLKAE